jgi:triacylglycerol lipase
MKLELERRGHPVHALDLVPNTGGVSLPELALQLESYVSAHFSEEQRLDIVGFSMGGLVSRYYMQRLGGIQRVRRFVAIGTPHRGTWTAYLWSNPGIRDMRPGSAFLEDLNRDIEQFESISFTSIWTPFDLMIVPYTSSRARVGRSFQVRTLIHALLIVDPRVLQLVAGILSDER